MVVRWFPHPQASCCTPWIPIFPSFPAEILVLTGQCLHANPGLLQSTLQKVPLLPLFFPPYCQTFKALLHHQVGLTQRLCAKDTCWIWINANCPMQNEETAAHVHTYPSGLGSPEWGCSSDAGFPPAYQDYEGPHHSSWGLQLPLRWEDVKPIC